MYDHSDDRPVAKLSEGKATLPGLHQVFRKYADGVAQYDVIGMTSEFHVDSEPLMVEWMQDGQLTRPLPSLSEIRATTRMQLNRMPATVTSLATDDGPPYEVRLSDGLQDLIREVGKREQR